MNKPTRILTSIFVSLALGGMNAYHDSVKMTPEYQAHPVVTIIGNFFWAGLIAGSIVYFGSGWIAKRKERNVNKTNNPSGGDAYSGKVDDRFYDEVARELQENPMVPGLWTKAFSETGGDDAKARALYIKYRVMQLSEASQRQQNENQQTVDITNWLNWKRILAGVVVIGVSIVGMMILLSFVAWEHHKTNDPLANLPPAAEVEEMNRQQFEENRSKAEQGNAVAQYNLGIFYWKGQGVTEDWAEAAKWSRKAAEQGHPAAQAFLADRLLRGYGVTIKKDEAEAVKWYLRAAEQNYAEAQNSLGYCYLWGKGVPTNIVEACKWFNLAYAHDRPIPDVYPYDYVLPGVSADQKSEGKRLALEFKSHIKSLTNDAK
jgi:hypothetical protein